MSFARGTRYLGLLLVAVVIGSRWLGGQVASESAAFVPSVEAAAVRPLAGTGSCAGRSCHGSPLPGEEGNARQDEHTVWLAHDPHAHAYRRLLEPRSRDMVRRLGDSHGLAHEHALCLGCHVTPQLATLDPQDRFVRVERGFGVGCEACHGQASTWLDAHIRPGWRTLTSEQKSAQGLTPLEKPDTLARTCVGCHVGRPGHEIGHDLIAAGHPRLTFEVGTYLANMPAHWKPRPRQEGRLWAIGQAVAAERAAELLEQRARDQASVWPELADFDCFACHHDLGRSNAKTRRGQLQPNGWYFGVAHTLATDLAPGADVSAGMQRLARALGQFRVQREQVGDEAAQLRAQFATLRERLAHWQETPAFVRPRIDFLLQAKPMLTWDGAEQTYFALEALNHTAGDPRLAAALEAVRSLRAFPHGVAGPGAHFDAAEFFRKIRP